MSSESEIEPIYVLDTVALILHLTQDRALGGRARSVIRAAESGET